MLEIETKAFTLSFIPKSFFIAHFERGSVHTELELPTLLKFQVYITRSSNSWHFHLWFSGLNLSQVDHDMPDAYLVIVFLVL